MIMRYREVSPLPLHCNVRQLTNNAVGIPLTARPFSGEKSSLDKNESWLPAQFRKGKSFLSLCKNENGRIQIRSII